MKNYTMIKLKNESYDYLVIANSYENPVNDFLVKRKVPKVVCGSILFNLTLINGVDPNRYATARVENSEINLSSLKLVDTIEKSIENISKQYFIQNAFLVQNSVLPSALKYAILNDVV